MGLRGLNILYEDATLLLIDKPAGFTVEQIERELGYTGAHRIDKDTSGVLVFAKTPEALAEIRTQFKERTAEKRYICLVEGALKEGRGTIHTFLGRSPADRRKQKAWALQEPGPGRREAITEWKVLKRFLGYTLLEVSPKTGRKHQIRAHAASMGHPVAGDKLYGFKNQRIPRGLGRQFLHASRLKIAGKEFASELPDDLQRCLKRLKQPPSHI